MLISSWDEISVKNEPDKETILGRVLPGNTGISVLSIVVVFREHRKDAPAVPLLILISCSQFYDSWKQWQISL